MLTKKDLDQINEAIQKGVKAGFEEFYTTIFEPYVNRNEQQHEQIVEEMITMKKGIAGLQEDMNEVKEHMKDHDTRINKLEQTVSSN